MKTKHCRQLLKTLYPLVENGRLELQNWLHQPISVLSDRWNKVYFIVCSSLVRWIYVYIQELKGFSRTENVLTSHGIELALHRKNVADFKCTNQNVRTLYFRLKSVNELFAYLTSVTPWWWQTCYEIKRLENDIKSLTSVNILTKFARRQLVRHLTLPQTRFREIAREI